MLKSSGIFKLAEKDKNSQNKQDNFEWSQMPFFIIGVLIERKNTFFLKTEQKSAFVPNKLATVKAIMIRHLFFWPALCITWEKLKICKYNF